MKKEALKKLEGTDRQITFANDIREYVLYQLEHSDDQESAILVAKAVKRTKKAKWIIDTFVKSYYDKTVLGHVKAMFLEDPKLSKAKQLKQSDFKYYFNDPTYLNHDKLDDKKKVSEVKDVAFNNSDAREHQEIASGIKKVKKYLSYQDSNIKSGYYSNICDSTIVESIKSLQKLGQNVSEYKERYSKQEPYYYIYRAKDYLGYQDQNIESGYYSDKCDKVITSMIDNLKELKQDTANLESRYLKQKADKAKLEATKEAKKAKQRKIVPSFVSKYNWDVGTTIYRFNTAIEIVKTEKSYLNDDDIVGLQETGYLKAWEDYPSGYYYFIYYKNIGDTDEGKEIIAEHNKKVAEKKKHQQMYQKASKALDSFIEKFKVPTNYLSEEDFQKELEDLFEKAKTIYEDDSFGYNNDYLALNKNDFFIADYNGLDGDDWGPNNSGSYIVFHVKLTNEQVKEIKRLIIEFEKVKD